jgi:hypothetical protein
VFIDADEADLRDWFMQRFRRLRETAFADPKSFFHRFTKMSTEEAEAFECADRIVLVSRGQVVDDVDVRRFTDVEELAEHLSSVTRTDERRAEGLADTVTEEE